MMVSLKSSAFSHGCFDGFSHVFPDFKEGGLVQVKDFLPMDLAQDADLLRRRQVAAGSCRSQPM